MSPRAVAPRGHRTELGMELSSACCSEEGSVTPASCCCPPALRGGAPFSPTQGSGRVPGVPFPVPMWDPSAPFPFLPLQIISLPAMLCARQGAGGVYQTFAGVFRAR